MGEEGGTVKIGGLSIAIVCRVASRLVLEYRKDIRVVAKELSKVHKLSGRSFAKLVTVKKGQADVDFGV